MYKTEDLTKKEAIEKELSYVKSFIHSTMRSFLSKKEIKDLEEYRTYLNKLQEGINNESKTNV